MPAAPAAFWITVRAVGTLPLPLAVPMVTAEAGDEGNVTVTCFALAVRVDPVAVAMLQLIEMD
jgi:hypothetical protein